MLIGVDFDNTIVSYDVLFHREARLCGLIDSELPRLKSSVRQQIWERHGDLAWQRVQGQVYGPRMTQADPIPGALEFFKLCHSRGFPTCIVSHKTEFGHFDETLTPLRDVALLWLEEQGFFQQESTGLSRDRVWFEPTREQKIERINALGCSHFIDDLPEVLLYPGLNPETERIWFCGAQEPCQGLLCCSDWSRIAALFGGGGRP